MTCLFRWYFQRLQFKYFFSFFYIPFYDIGKKNRIKLYSRVHTRPFFLKLEISIDEGRAQYIIKLKIRENSDIIRVFVLSLLHIKL